MLNDGVLGSTTVVSDVEHVIPATPLPLANGAKEVCALEVGVDDDTLAVRQFGDIVFLAVCNFKQMVLIGENGGDTAVGIEQGDIAPIIDLDENQPAQGATTQLSAGQLDHFVFRRDFSSGNLSEPE